MMALKKSLSIIMAAALMFTTAVPAMADTAAAEGTDIAVPTAAEMVEAGEYADDQIIVVFDDGVKDSKIESTIEGRMHPALKSQRYPMTQKWRLPNWTAALPLRRP